jgi:hypothetical protein
MDGILLLILSRLKVLNGLFDTAFDFQSTDATTNWNVEEGLLSKDEALLFKTDATTSLKVAEDLSQLIWFVEVMGAHTNNAKVLHETLVVKVTGSRANNVKTLHESFVDEVTGSHTNNAKALHETFFDEVTGSHANNAKMLHETFFGEVTDSNPVWEWTQQFNPELRFERKVAKGTRADITRLLCFGPCQLDGWVFDESVLLLWISLSCPWLLNITRSDFLLWHSPPFDERLTGSNTSCPNHLVGSRLGSFVGLLIGCCNQVEWLIRTWFPVTELRLVNAFAWLAKKNCQWHQELQKSRHCNQSLWFNWCPINILKCSQFCLCNLAKN